MATEKTVERLKQSFYFTNMTKIVDQILKECEVCVLYNKRREKVAFERTKLPDSALSQVHIDLAGPLPVLQAGNRYILICCDYLTGFLEAVPIPDRRTDTVLNAWHNTWTVRYGLPDTVTHDRAKEFMSQEWTDYFKQLGIKTILSTPQHPASNGLAERSVQNIKRIVSKLVDFKPNHWENTLPDALYSLRISTRSTSGFTPYEALFGKPPSPIFNTQFIESHRAPGNPARLRIMKNNWSIIKNN